MTAVLKERKVCILLSTYNGERFISSQMDSLVNQDYSPLEILVRDDGSIDQTCKIVKDYVGITIKGEVIRGDNVGVVRSFWTLLRQSPADVDYLAFCDQDDVWTKDKITRAVSFMMEARQGIPVMYFSRLTIVNENLEPCHLSKLPSRQPTFKNALVENIATGCTIVINDAARRLLLKHPPCLDKVIMHDWWVYLAVSAFGKVHYDECPTVLYRQHQENLVGSQRGFRAFQGRVKRFLQYGGRLSCSSQAREFEKCFADCLPSRSKKALRRFIADSTSGNLLSRLVYSMKKNVFRQNAIDDQILRLLIMLRRV